MELPRRLGPATPTDSGVSWGVRAGDGRPVIGVDLHYAKQVAVQVTINRQRMNYLPAYQ